MNDAAGGCIVVSPSAMDMAALRESLVQCSKTIAGTDQGY
jgi:hypothetical protein